MTIHLQTENKHQSKRPRLDPPVPLLKTTEVARENLSLIQETLSEWEITAWKKETLSTSTEDKELFSDLWLVAFGANVDTSLQSHNSLCVICKSPSSPEVIQAISLFTKQKEHIFLNFLITNPHNIRAPINEFEEDKVCGAGSAIIQHLFKVCIEENLERIRLLSTDSSIEFYTKMGFTPILGPNKCMQITAEEIQERLSNIPSLKQVA